MKFKPKLMTSMRPHGKWGDLLICCIPITWCINILINSNFLLKMIEWQSETSLFTIRIRGRQWYWVYKFDLKDFSDILSVNKNVGHNKIFFSSFSDLKTMDNYLHSVNLRATNRFLKKYWNVQLYKFAKPDDSFLASPVDSENISIENFNFSSFRDLIKNPNFFFKRSISFYNNSLNFFKKNFFNNTNLSADTFSLYNPFDFFSQKDIKKDNFVLFNIFDESLRWAKRSSGVNSPLRLIKLPLNNYLEGLSETTLFRTRFTDESTVIHKNIPNTNYFTFKQKRYKYRNKVFPSVRYYRNQETGEKTNIVKSKTNPILLKNSIFLDDYKTELSNSLRLLQKNKKHDEFFSVSLYRRLLRVRKTLVLPAHVNICAITNSYDVVHSWFIPGLGLKFDCIPGRATHHTFYIDNVGFYYGQCAEICGRYHHHMPIKVCALPFEHFIIWWQSFGLQRLTYTNSQKKYNTYYNFRKFVW